MNVNPPPLNDLVEEKSNRQFSAAWKMFFGALYTLVQKLQAYPTSYYQTPNAGFSIQTPPGVEVLTLEPAGALANGTVILPADPYDGQRIAVQTVQDVTALTVSATKTIKNAPTTILAGTGFAFRYDSQRTSWYRLY